MASHKTSDLDDGIGESWKYWEFSPNSYGWSPGKTTLLVTTSHHVTKFHGTSFSDSNCLNQNIICAVHMSAASHIHNKGANKRLHIYRRHIYRRPQCCKIGWHYRSPCSNDVFRSMASSPTIKILLPLSYTHTHTHARTRARARTHTHTHTQTQIHAHTLMAVTWLKVGGGKQNRPRVIRNFNLRRSKVRK
jgi:hypothetical protein